MSILSASRPKSGYADRRGGHTTSATARPAALDVEALYRSHGDMVLGRCRSLLRHEADAQDACQEVFLKVHRYKDSFRAEARPSTYLFKVTTTVCLNRLRSRRRRREDLQDEPAPVPVTDTLLQSADLRELTELVLKLADEKTQKAIVYHYVDGMTHAEVGALLGLSAAAIRKRIATFKKRFAANPPPWLAEVELLMGN